MLLLNTLLLKYLVVGGEQGFEGRIVLSVRYDANLVEKRNVCEKDEVQCS